MIVHKFKAVFAGLLLAMCVTAPSHADDIEIYTTGALGAPTIQPNVMFIVDTSGSMQGTVTGSQAPYDYNTTYAGPYTDGQIYFSTSNGTTPSSHIKYSFNASANNCDNSLETYDNGKVIDTVGPLQKYGHYEDQMAQFSSNKWNAMNTANNNSAQRAYLVECAADAGIHGSNAAPTPNMWITNSSTGWTNTATSPQVWSGGANMLYIYTGNYLNYLTNPPTTSQSKLDIVENAVTAIAGSNNNINICLMQYDTGLHHNGIAEGGPVIYLCTDVKAGRQNFYSLVKNLAYGVYTPLSETYYEALLYFGGRVIDYGATSNPSISTGAKENGLPTNYQTPITNVCQKNYIVYLTDGAPTYDHLSATRQSVLPGFPVGSCDAPPDDPTAYSSNLDAFTSAASSDDNCLDELAGWAHTNDIATRTDIPAFDGKQTVTTYTVGFGADVQSDAGAVQLLQDTANAGGGKFYTATDAASLQLAFDKIVGDILAINSTFSSPAVSVNAYNRSTNLDDLYFTLFKPASGPHWNGNLKKFKLAFDSSNNPFIADANGVNAVDPTTGFFKDTSTSYWTQPADAPDGADPSKGGAAGMLTLPSPDGTPPRNVYTFTGTYTNNNGVLSPTGTTGDLTSSTNLLSATNSNITDTMLGGVASYPTVSYPHAGSSVTVSYQTALLMWAEGYDILDTTPSNPPDNEAIEPRRIMGDPLHAQPALVQYGQIGSGSTAKPDLVAYVATNDGYLHAFNSLTGQEDFSFVPQELLPNLSKIFDNNASSGKSYGLDGDVIPWIHDDNHDGAIKASDGDFVYLYFGQRRGGRNIYSMDVTDRTSPKLRWMIEGGVGDFAELGQTWSAPDVAKLKLGGVDREVLIFGAGYDTAQDSDTVRTADTVGRGIYIVDAITGQMLWRAGPDSGASTQMLNMNYSIPGRIVALDMDGDGYIDRLYAGDMGGQLWRFDIKPSDTSTDLSTLITGGRIADLAVDSDTTAVRRFYYPPDVGLIAEPGKPPYLAVVAISGYRAHPLNTTVHDRAYMIRDTDVYNKPANSDYAAKMVTEADLYDTTANLIGGGNGTTTPTTTQQQTAATSLANAKGWYINLQQTDGSWIGEKGLSEPLILNGNAIFTTYIPSAIGQTATSCTPNAGTGAAYFVHVTDGTPTYHAGTVGTAPDRNTYLKRTGIPPSPNVIVTDKGVATLCVGAECTKANISNTVQKSYWYEQEQ
jgi:type IV pilus assembly protein PilY1